MPNDHDQMVSDALREARMRSAEIAAAEDEPTRLQLIFNSCSTASPDWTRACTRLRGSCGGGYHSDGYRCWSTSTYQVADFGDGDPGMVTEACFVESAS